ncbi:MAG: aminodeoxychorismate synthase component I [Gammaproteobacteria bacterium]|nr:aminodeoxychorismate synthase component I [Gammaproteobacteria bacterium]
MRAPSIIELPYRPDSADSFEALADRPWSMFIDSGRPWSSQGRYDILVADPIETLVTRGVTTEIRSADTVVQSFDDPLTLLQQSLTRYGLITPMASLPFVGGAVGYFAYDLGRRFERLPAVATDVGQLPEMAVGIYDWAVVVDHVAQRSAFVAVGTDAERYESLAALFHQSSLPPQRTALRALAPLDTTLDRDGYGAAFRRVLGYIAAGDCYQVNLARRFSAPVAGDPWAGYRALRSYNPAPYAAYLNTPNAQVLSASPERFLQVHDGVVETKPIKGTRPRHADPAVDKRIAAELLASAKDRAENVMIVDLLRNDLGKVCEYGSVHVDALCALESFATVHHLVSTVSGRLAPKVQAIDVLRACFPGGSITGAPKIRAMEIIEDLEHERRGVYCGAIGYIGFDGAMDTNIAIRTMVHQQGEMRFWAGGGLVADSVEDSEYQETIDKAAALVALLQP